MASTGNASEAANLLTLLRERAVIEDLLQVLNFPTDLGLFFHGAVLPDSIEAHLAEHEMRLSASGVSLNRQESVRRTIGEAVERFAFVTWSSPPDSTLEARADETWERLPFQLPASWTSSQCRRYLREIDLVTCCLPVFTTARRAAPVPLGLLCCAEKRHQWATTSGMACGPSWEFAAIRALLELLERSVTMTAWYGNLHGAELEPTACLPAEWLKLLDAFPGRAMFRLFVGEIPLPVVVCALKIADRRLGAVHVGIGSACRGTFREACVHALSEASLCLHYVHHYAMSVPVGRYNRSPQNFAEHCLHYQNDNAGTLMKWLRPAKYTDLRRLIPSSRIQSLDGLLSLFRQAGHEVSLFDMTPPVLRDVPVKVVRAIVPGLVPFLIADNLPLFCRSFRTGDFRFAVGVRPFKDGSQRDLPHPFP